MFKCLNKLKYRKKTNSEDIFFHKSVLVSLLKIVIPASISMAIYSLYTIIDQIIAIKLGPGKQWGAGGYGFDLTSSDIRTIIQVCLPYYTLIVAGLAISSGGLSNSLSFHFGRKDRKNAVSTLGNSLFINLIIIIFFLIFALSFSKIFIQLQINGSDPKDLELASISKWICWTWTFGIFFYYVSNIIIWTIRTKGFMMVSMSITLICSLLNIGLDVLFVKVFHSGVLGTIIATAICWVVQFFISLIYCAIVKDLWVFFDAINFRHWKISKSIIITLIIFGLPSLFRNSLQGVAYYIFNIILSHMSQNIAGSKLPDHSLVSIFGAVTPFLTFFTISIFGFLQGMNMFTSHNLARKYLDRIKKSISISFAMMFVYLIVVEILVLALAPYLVTIFVDPNDVVFNYATKALRYTFIFFPLISCSFIPISYYQSTLRYKKAIFITFLRFIILYVPVSLIYYFIFRDKDQLFIFLSLPTTDFILALVVMIDFYFNVRNLTMEKLLKHSRKIKHFHNDDYNHEDEQEIPSIAKIEKNNDVEILKE
ncbi:MATE family efflux transporter [Mycoplasma sp. SG1]|uniref:MATE family efflux transporter n=1 Tax=Mycoplasma sp. SG1 TaxID=2810348 RepID=UPI0020259DB9|nr:MATE family efflux transporter [Mycoplasma sp. SG1]URM53187.1 hypothetical protein JRW51_02460 [Mycoplasma sp. SG1]